MIKAWMYKGPAAAGGGIPSTPWTSPTMSSDVLPVPYILTATMEQYAHEAWQTWDRDTGTYWGANWQKSVTLYCGGSIPHRRLRKKQEGVLRLRPWPTSAPYSPPRLDKLSCARASEASSMPRRSAFRFPCGSSSLVAPSEPSEPSSPPLRPTERRFFSPDSSPPAPVQD